MSYDYKMDCQVQVTEGVLQGKECVTFYGRKYYSFEGIPYAKPPVGQLRFRNPVPCEPWSGVLDATKPGNKCLQANPYANKSFDGSEDCLYLNIYTPYLPNAKLQSYNDKLQNSNDKLQNSNDKLQNSNDKLQNSNDKLQNTLQRLPKLPVIFFVHGGRLIFGHANYYSPDYLLKHDVILVTVNYRLHIFGWLCLNLPECTGNMGLKDTVMALKWVNKNISSFNGDSSNITVFGESAGAAIVTSYLTSDMTKGLFSKVIAEAGNCIADLFWGDETPIPKAFNLALILGRDMGSEQEILDYFMECSAEELCMAFAAAELNRSQSTIQSYLLPVVEVQFEGVECFFKEHPRICLRENRFHKVPVISTMHSHEGVLFFREGDDVRYEEDFYYYIPYYARVERDTPKATEIQKKIKQFYLKDKNMQDAKLEYLDLISDAYFTRDIMSFVETLSRYSQRVYSMKFGYLGKMNTRAMSSIGVKGATHGDMIQYQFYRQGKASQGTARDSQVVEMLSEAFCNFAKKGTPTWRNQKTKWLPYTQQDRRTLVVADDITCDKNVDQDRLHFWMRLFSEPSKL